MPVLAYWDIRGLAQPARLMLEYAGVEFEDKKYEVGPGPEYNRDSWLKEKFTLGLGFPNLPYYIDGDVKLTQSNAILRYIARKYGLYGSSEAQQAEIDMLCEQVMDMRNAAVRFFYNSKFSELKEGYLKEYADKLALFEKYLGDKQWLCGSEITFPDFHLYEMLDQHKKLEPTVLDKFPKLQAYKDRFENLPKIKAYMASDRFMKGPCNNKMAGWRGE